MRTAVILLAFMAILFYAIHRGRDVRVCVRLLGTAASLEVTDRHTVTGGSGGEGHEDRTREHVERSTRDRPGLRGESRRR